MDETRFHELIWMNRVLAALVVLLAFAGGFLLAQKQNWLVTTPTFEAQTPPPQINQTPSKAIETLPRVKAVNDGMESILQKLLPVYSFIDGPISKDALSHLLWSGYGLNTEWGNRVVPSYKSMYPLEISAIVTQSDTLLPGVYRYVAKEHGLSFLGPATIDQLGVEQQALLNAPTVLVVSADISAYQQQQKSVGVETVWIEAGHVAQNIILAASEIDLGVVEVVRFDQETVRTALHLPADEKVLLLLAIGKSQGE